MAVVRARATAKKTIHHGEPVPSQGPHRTTAAANQAACQRTELRAAAGLFRSRMRDFTWRTVPAK